MPLRPLLLAGVVLLTPSFSPAQTSGDAPRPFRSGVELVRLDVRVTDDAGRPIPDLRPEEIELYDKGERLPVVLFQRVTEPAGSYVDEAIRATTAEVSSNAAFPRGHLYILIFDQQHIAPGNEQRVRMAAEEFVRRRVRPSDRVALYAVPGPGPQIGFTADKLRVIKELASIRGSYRRVVSSPLGTMGVYEAHRVVQGDERLIAELMERMAFEAGADLRPDGGEDAATTRRLLQENARTIVNQSDSESRQFLQRLSDVIAGFRDIEGRKTVVLFSEGFFQDNLARELEAVAAAAAQSYCVFYAFDLNQRGISPAEASISETTQGSEIQARIAPLATLAVETDGMLIVDAAARSGKALDALADQAQEYYLVGFTPPQEARLNRGKYRRVTVKVGRSGARASARTGYAVAPEPAAADRRRAIDTVLGAPFVQQGLKLDYTTYVLKGTERGQQRVVLSLTADLPVRSGAADAADVVFVVRDARDGHVVASGTGAIPLPAAPRDGAPLGTGAWRVQFTVPPGSYLMRAVVREPGGLAGSADRRLVVRALDGPDVTVSDLVIGSASGGLPVRPLAYTGDGLTGLVEAYARGAGQLESLDVRMELRRQSDGARVTTLGADLRDPEQDGTGMSRAAQLMMPLSDVPPGEYVLHAVVRAGGEIVGERTRQVEILAGRAPAGAADGVAHIQGAWTPLELVQGHLARTYIAWLAEQAKGTPGEEAARLAMASRWEQIEAALRRIPAAAGVVPHALRGLALLVREDYRGAAAALQLATGAAPGDALTAFFLGWACEGAGDKPAALGAWRRAAYLDPSLVSAHLALADGYLRLSQPALAVQALEAGLSKLPSSPELLAKLEQIERRRNTSNR